MTYPRMPIQPIQADEHGRVRFVKNRIVDMMLEEPGPWDMNTIYIEVVKRGFTENEYFHFQQMIGYSVDGIPVPDDLAETEINSVRESIDTYEARIVDLQAKLERMKALMRPAVAELFEVHPEFDG